MSDATLVQADSTEAENRVPVLPGPCPGSKDKQCRCFSRLRCARRNLFLIRVALPSLNEGRSLILPQLDMLCFVDTKGRPAPFGAEAKKEWFGGGEEQRRGGGREW